MHKIRFNQGMLRWQPPAQLLLVMKLTTVIIITCLLQVSAATFGQKITIVKNGIPLSEVFKEIRKQTGYNVLWQPNQVDVARRLNLNIRNRSLVDAMNQIVKSNDLDFSIEEGTVMVKRKERSYLETIIDRFQAIDVEGRVVDSTGVGLGGASITVKNGKGSTVTDAVGNFRLRGLQEGAVLVVSYLGFVTREITPGKEFNYVILKQSESKLDEIQVIAYGTTSRRLSTGNISTVKAAEIERSPVSNPLLVLQGRVPGVVIEQANGLPGSGIKVRIQGTNSLGKGNDPLYVIDGVPFRSQNLPQLLDILGVPESSFDSGQGNPLSFINPADIESIDVLKDADATSIYGSRAAAGAILITTKKGKAGETAVNFTLTSGVGEMTRRLDLLNTEQYLAMRREAIANTPGAQITESDYDLNGTWDQNRYTDWQDELLGGKASQYSANISLSGGSEQTKYLMSGSHSKVGTIFPGDFSDTKTSVHFNINNRSMEGKLTVNLDGTMLIGVNELPQTDVTREAITLAPNAPQLRNSDGTLNWATQANGNSSWQNPLADLTRTYRNKTTNIIGNALISYKIADGLDIKSTVGFNSVKADEFAATPFRFAPPEMQEAFTASSKFGNSEINTVIFEPQVTYKRKVWLGQLDALIGGTYQKTLTNRKQFDAYGFTTDLALENSNAATSISSPLPLASVYKYVAFFGRVSYNVDDRYILNLTTRRDGSSRFGDNNMFNNFASIGAAWLFSNEEFMKSLEFLSFGKLRASYGTTGNDQIGEYAFMSLYDYIFYDTPYQNVGGLRLRDVANPDLQWEETRKLQFGLELGFLKDRLTVSGNYYRNRSSNQLQYIPMPGTTGTSGYLTNFPAIIQNSGFEFSSSADILRRRDFQWTAALNFTLPKNKLVSYPGLETSSQAGSLFIGKPINVVNTFKYAGVNAETGLYQYFGLNGNLTSEPLWNERQILVNTTPDFFAGLSNSISYKGFALTFLIQYTQQRGFGYEAGDRPGVFFAGNQPVTVLERWQKNGDIAQMAKFSVDPFPPGYYQYRFSDQANSDASFLRLKNVSLEWRLPERWRHQINARNVRLFLQGQNLLTVTRYFGLDPETRSQGVLPPLRVVSAGIHLTF